VLVRLSRRMVSLCRIRGCSSTVRFGNAGGGGERGDGIGPKLGAAWMVASTRPAGIFRLLPLATSTDGAVI
jgi:hypothetical protein